MREIAVLIEGVSCRSDTKEGSTVRLSRRASEAAIPAGTQSVGTRADSLLDAVLNRVVRDTNPAADSWAATKQAIDRQWSRRRQQPILTPLQV